ncbi:MAG TPA: bifunctional acetaldehyde-CoA/alcohol dehydrogenase [Planktothrix sp.]|jgi:acetaldehyde dehydrogenase/alcohol dehydrogenase
MTTTTKEQDLGLNERVNSLVRRARLAAAVFTQYSQEDVDRIVRAMTIAALESIEQLAIHAHEETRMGLIEDKVLKNFVASEFHYHQIKDKRTVGIVREFPEDNMVEVAEPMGVILALSPVTNPTSTVIFKAIAAVKTRNTIIFSPHLMAADSSNTTAKILYDAGIAAGAPKGFISWVEKSPRLRRETELMMVHPEVDLIFATGGTNMVHAAYSSGKPALGVGPGNTPVYITSTATPMSAAMDVLISKTFDNGVECPSEQTLIIDKEIAPELLKQFKRMNCYICTPEEVDKVAAVAIDPRTGGMNYKLVGQSADTIAKAAGLDAPAYTKIILCPLLGDLRYHKLAVEKLMPVLGFVIVDSVDQGINRALDINYAGGTGHTAGIYSEDDSVIERFATAINAGRIIVNCPTSLGGLGGIYNNLNTTLSFGCGTGGGNITTDNVGIKNLLNYKRVPKRTNFTLAFQTTKNIYINPGSLDHLRGLKTTSAFIVTSRSASKRGHLSQVMERLPSDCQVQTFSDIGAEPDWNTVQKAVNQMRQCAPDTIIALGGGSVLDAAKIIRLFYDYPELKLSELSVKFLDFRHRMVQYPQKMKTHMVAIPTTSGTGSEVTPFAVLKDNEAHRKISLVDESLLPDVAIIDANLTKSLPREITVDTAFDALTHALESLVSTYGSDYTDGLALEAVRLIFEALPEALKTPTNIVWRHKLHNAACLAGMAIGNASVGINHGLAHSFGATFNIPHGRANGVFLLATVELNSKIPRKFMPSSTYPMWVADEKYARAARFIGLKPAYEPDRNGGAGQEDDREAMILALRRALYDLAKNAGQPMSISELGIARQDFDRALPGMVRLAAEDMSMRTNPSLPLIDIIADMFVSSYLPRQRP